MNSKVRYLTVLKQRFFLRSAALLLLTALSWPLFVEPGLAAESATAHQLSCTPKTFTRVESLNIEVGVSHPGELAIVRPDGEYFFIAQRVLGNSTVKAIPSDIFSNIVALKISPQTFVAHRWRTGAPDYELVFNELGTYKVILGEPLESDIEGTAQACEVTLVK